MKNRWKFACFILSVVVVVLAIILLKVNPSSNAENAVQDQSKLYKDYTLLRSENGMLKYSIQQAIVNEGMKVNEAMLYTGTDTSKLLTAKDILCNPVLIFRFSGDYCESCIEFVIAKIKLKFPDYGTNKKIIFLCSETSMRVKDTYYGKALYSYHQKSSLGLPFEAAKTPFLFVLDIDKRSRAFFIPDMQQPQLLETYLNTVKKQFTL